MDGSWSTPLEAVVWSGLAQAGFYSARNSTLPIFNRPQTSRMRARANKRQPEGSPIHLTWQRGCE
jgi:hypothetical protein